MSSQKALKNFLKQDTKSRLLGLIDNLEPKIQSAFLQAVVLIRESNTLDVLEELLLRGQIDEALAVTNRAITQLSNVIAQGYIDGGQSTAQLIAGDLDVVIAFDVANERAINEIRNTKFRLIREFTQEQRRATQSALLDGIRRGANPRDQARAFVDSIGLTERQQGAVNNFRRLLEAGDRQALTRDLRDRRFDRTILSAINGDRDLAPDQVDRMVSRYAERYVRFRSEVIARTEALRATHQGANDMWEQAIEDEVVQRDKVIRVWQVAGDSRVRDSHDAMQGQERSLNEPFISGNGNALMFPGDPAAPPEDTIQCRCVATTRITN